MPYIHIESGDYLLTESAVRARCPGAMIPEPFVLPDGYASVSVAPYPAFDSMTEQVMENAPQEVGGVWGQSFSVVPLSAEAKAENILQRKAQIKASATEKRWAVETGGIVLPGGAEINTSVEDQNRITAVVANASAAGVSSIDFKSAGGWATLSVIELKAIASAIALHVQACFSAERAHHEAIDAINTAQECTAYDLSAGWPV